MSTARNWVVLGALLVTRPVCADEPRSDCYGDPLPQGAVARLGTMRFRHGSPDSPSAEFLPDGKTIITGTSDGKIRYWEAATGKLLQAFPAEEDNSLLCMALSKDGKKVAVGGYKGASIWDVDGRTLLHRLAAPVISIGFSPDGKTLVTGGVNEEMGVTRVCDVASGKEKRNRLQWHNDRIQQLIIAPDNRTLISVSSGDRKTHIGDLESGQIKYTISEQNLYVWHADLAPDGKTLVLAGERRGVGGMVEIYDVVAGKQIRSLDNLERWIMRARFLPDGKELITYAHDDTVTRWDTTTWKAMPPLPERGWIHRVSPDGRTFMRTYGADLKLFDFASGKPLHDFDGHIANISSLAYSSDGKLIASASEGVRLWDPTTSKTVRTLGGRSFPVWVNRVQAAPGGFLTTYSNSTARLWDAANGQEVRQFSLKGRRLNTAMNISADGKRVLCSSLGDLKSDRTITIAVLDLATGNELDRRELERMSSDSFDVAIFVPDGSKYIRRADVGISMIEFNTGKELCRILTPDIIDDPFAFAPDGRSFAIRTSTLKKEGLQFSRTDHKVRVFETETGKVKFAIALAGWRQPLTFSFDGRLLAAVSERTLVLCDASTGKELWRSPELEHRPSAIAFAPDSMTLASGHSDGNVLIWDIGRVATGNGKRP